MRQRKKSLSAVAFCLPRLSIPEDNVLRTDTENMDNPLYGIALKVRNLELTRSFYRDVLELGAPVIDSNFWVEFRLGDGVPFILDKVLEDEHVPESGGRISWIFKTNEIEPVVARLRLFGYEPKCEPIERIGLKVYEFRDPEGNPFLVCANAGKTQQSP
jgi:hypothetical protein